MSRTPTVYTIDDEGDRDPEEDAALRNIEAGLQNSSNGADATSIGSTTMQWMQMDEEDENLKGSPGTAAESPKRTPL
ncbi:MAG: hypothetical protein SGARI_001660, partial [Bacillariaceae sp.]